MKILVLNSGSSSQKTALFQIEQEPSADPIPPLWEGKLDWDGDHETLTARNSSGAKIHSEDEVRNQDRQLSVENLINQVWSGPTAVLKNSAEISLVGHRIVHGGAKLTQPTIVTQEVKRAISDVSAIAPLHNKPGLEGIELSEKLLPKTTQIAVFDTGFHSTLPLKTQVY